MEDGDHLLLQNGSQIDQYIAAADQIHTRKRWIAEHVLSRENTHIADRLRNLITSGHFMKEAAQTYFRDFAGNRLFVDSGACFLNGVLAEVCAKNLNRHFNSEFRKRFDQRDRVGIRLLSGRAAGHPNAHRLRSRAIAEQLRINHLMEAVEDFGVTEKASDIDQDIPVESLHLLRVAMQQLDVIAQLVDMVNVHAAQDPPADRRYFVIDKIDFAVALQQPEYILHQTFFSIKSIVWRFPFRGLFLKANEFLCNPVR